MPTPACPKQGAWHLWAAFVVCGLFCMPVAKAESFWAPALRSANQIPASPLLDKTKPDIAGLRLGMPSIAAKRVLVLSQEPPLLVTELFNDEVPGAYGLMAYDMTHSCRVQNMCEVRMRVLFSRGKVWFIAREYMDGPHAVEAEATAQMNELATELALHYRELAAPPGAGPGNHLNVARFFSRDGREDRGGGECASVPAQEVVGIEPLNFPSTCGWSYRHSLGLQRVGTDFYVNGTLQLVDMDQPYPETTEPKARRSDAR